MVDGARERSEGQPQEQRKPAQGLRFVDAYNHREPLSDAPSTRPRMGAGDRLRRPAPSASHIWTRTKCLWSCGHTPSKIPVGVVIMGNGTRQIREG